MPKLAMLIGWPRLNLAIRWKKLAPPLSSLCRLLCLYANCAELHDRAAMSMFGARKARCWTTYSNFDYDYNNIWTRCQHMLTLCFWHCLAPRLAQPCCAALFSFVWLSASLSARLPISDYRFLLFPMPSLSIVVRLFFFFAIFFRLIIWICKPFLSSISN